MEGIDADIISMLTFQGRQCSDDTKLKDIEGVTNHNFYATPRLGGGGKSTKLVKKDAKIKILMSEIPGVAKALQQAASKQPVIEKVREKIEKVLREMNQGPGVVMKHLTSQDLATLVTLHKNMNNNNVDVKVQKVCKAMFCKEYELIDAAEAEFQETRAAIMKVFTYIFESEYLADAGSMNFSSFAKEFQIFLNKKVGGAGSGDSVMEDCGWYCFVFWIVWSKGVWMFGPKGFGCLDQRGLDTALGCV